MPSLRGGGWLFASDGFVFHDSMAALLAWGLGCLARVHISHQAGELCELFVRSEARRVGTRWLECRRVLFRSLIHTVRELAFSEVGQASCPSADALTPWWWVALRL